MKKRIFFLKTGIYLLLHTTIFVSAEAKDSIHSKRYGFGGTPILAFDPDLGLRYGAVVNLFDFGPAPNYQVYEQFLNIRAFNSTKGSSIISLIYETEKTVPGSVLFIETSVIRDTKLDFFGFNGVQSVFNNDFIHPESPVYINKFFYSHYRRLIRLRADLHKRIGSGKWKLLLGTTWLDFSIGETDFNLLVPPQGADGSPAENTSLYKKYMDWGIIPGQDALGGRSADLMTGIAYDSRNNRINCTRGIWVESYYIHSINFNLNEAFGKHVMSARHYLELNNLKSIFTWRISSQQKLFGRIPFYMLPFYYDTRQNQDGMGGAFTLRGVYRNRVTANGFLTGNLEWRRKILHFNFLKLNWDIQVSAFADGIYITREHPVNYGQVPARDIEVHFLPFINQSPLYTLGLGMYLIYNKNNITSVNFGWSPDQRFGKTGVYVGSAFLF